MAVICVETDGIVNSITRNREAIFKMLDNDRKSFADYQFIMDEFIKGNIVNNSDFLNVFKTFYAMISAGLTQAFFDKYFQLLESRENNMNKILETLSEIPRIKGDHAVELSFASKLIHTINPSMPIFDRNVARALGMSLDYIPDFDRRLKDRVQVYEQLKKRFAELLRKSDVQKVISDFRNRLNLQINDVKMLDFILWKLGALLNGIDNTTHNS